MADEKKNDKDKEAQSDAPVANLHVSQIIAALHQNAISKCKDELGDKFRIVNSAIDDAGNNPVLNSQGEHIISVIPTDNAAKKNIAVPLESAVAALKKYVHWFVGPDLAKKINEKNIGVLGDSNDKSNTAGKSKSVLDKQDEQLHDLDESSRPFMTFSQFLREQDEQDQDEQQKQEINKQSQEKDPSKPENKEQDSKQDKDQDKKKNPNAKLQKIDMSDTIYESQLGYYIVYEMKVEGLKKETKEDAMKSMRKSIVNYLGNFFDDVKITASGLFGGGESFTVKDVKDKLRNTFGPIDPDELARNVEERINKKFKGASPHADVEIKNKRTLIPDLGSFISGKEKQQIESADYSLWIKLDYTDPKKQVLNRGAIADIVQASITGLWKKFKNRIKADDVIYIKNYKDIHANTEKIKKLYNNTPSPNDIQARIDKARDLNDAVSKIKKMFERIISDKDRDDCDRAERCSQLWDNFYKENKLGDNEQIEKLKNIHNGSRKFKEYFKAFIEKYAKTYKETEDKELSESIHSVVFSVSNSKISQMLIESMFGPCIALTNEEENDSKDTSQDSDEQQFSAEDAANHAKLFLKQSIGDDYEIPNIECKLKDDVIKELALFKVPDELKNDKHVNAIAIVPNLLSESHISNDIFSILFESNIVHSSTSILLETKLEDFINANNLSKENALKDENIKKLKDILGYSTEKTRDKVKIYFAIKDFVKDNKLSKEDTLKDENVEKLKDILHLDNKKTLANIKAYFSNKSNANSVTDVDSAIKNSFRKALENANAKDIGDFFALKAKTFNESTNDQKTKDKKYLQNAYVMTFGNEEMVSPVDPSDIDANDVDSSESTRNDLYIIPMPGLSYEDPEYANKKLM